MYSFNQVMDGINKYLNEEILMKINGWQRWIIGAGMGVYMQKGTDIFNSLKTNEMVKMLNVIDENDHIDVECLFRELRKQAEKSSVTFNFPLVGPMTLNDRDVDKLYHFIVE